MRIRLKLRKRETNTKGDDSTSLEKAITKILDCMVTRGVIINAKEGDGWKLQLE